MTKKQILMVEPDEALAQSTVVFLQSRQYKTDIAYNGADALHRLARVPDLLLIDCNLPDMTGVEVCRKVRGDERLQQIPIILLSNHTMSAEDLESLYVYGDDHITKPFDNRELLARMEVLFQQTQVSQQAQKEKEIVTRELKKIFKDELIVPFFQPIYSVEAMLPLGVEALSRPSTDTFLSNPELFFKAALTFGMYSEVEKLAWRKAFVQWEKNIGQGKLFLNCTPQFIGNNLLDETFFSALKIDPKRIVLELTERTAIQDHGRFVDKLNDIRFLGAKIAVDDVGSGFASLDTVAEVKPDFIKIDLSLICDIHFDSLKRNIVQSIIDFCHKSDIVTVAEGIERTEELQTVKDLGVDAVQGYLLGKPQAEISREIFSRRLDL